MKRLDAPTPEVIGVSCETVTLKWEPPEPDSSETDLEYELVVADPDEEDPISLITTSDTTYKVEHLEGGSNLEFRLRAKRPDAPDSAWSPQGRVTATTSGARHATAARGTRLDGRRVRDVLCVCAKC